MKAYVNSQRELVDILRVSPSAIKKWQRQHPHLKEPPYRTEAGYAIEAWLAFQAMTPRQRRGQEDDEQVNEISEEKLRQLILQNQKLEVQIRIMNRDYIHVSTVEDSAAKLGGAIRQIISRLHHHAPAVVKLPVPEAEQRLKEIEDELLTQLNTIDIEEGT